MEVKILKHADKEALLGFEQDRLEQAAGDPFEKEMASWSARWRPESLDHYLPQGWSFGAWSHDGRLHGYFLAQPLLFFEGLTQTLWVEQMSYDSEEAARRLVEVAYRWSRDKHLQSVVFSQGEELSFALEEFGGQPWGGSVWWLKTAKFKDRV